MASLRKTAKNKAEEKTPEVVEVEKVETKEAEAPEIKAIEVEKPKVVEQPMVRVVLNQDLSTYIGDQWYNFKADKQYNVPQNVKDILKNAGRLKVV